MGAGGPAAFESGNERGGLQDRVVVTVFQSVRQFHDGVAASCVVGIAERIALNGSSGWIITPARLYAQPSRNITPTARDYIPHNRVSISSPYPDMA
jgi:hypothetical protein